MTDSTPTPPLVDVIAEVLRVHVKRNIKGCDCGWTELGRAHQEHQARAVLDALTEVGGVEWAVRWAFEDAEHFRVFNNQEEAESVAHHTRDDFGQTTRAVSRITGPWTAVE